MSDVENNASGELSFADAMREYQTRQTSEETTAESTVETTADEQETEEAAGGTAEESATSEDHDEQEQEAEGKDDGKGKPKQSNLEKRFSKLTKTIRELEQKEAHWRELATKAQKPEPTTEAKPADDAKFYEPREGETQLDYDRRIIRHETQQALKAERDAEAKATKEAAERKAQEAAENSWKTKADAARDDIGDSFDEALAGFAAAAKTGKAGLTPHMEAFITDSEHGAKVLYHLATNLDEASEIAKLGPAAAARKLTAIEAQFVEKKDSTEDKKPPVTTKAPPPATPVRRPAAAASTEPSDNDDVDTWLRKRNAQLAKRGR